MQTNTHNPSGNTSYPRAQRRGLQEMAGNTGGGGGVIMSKGLGGVSNLSPVFQKIERVQESCGQSTVHI